VPVAGEIFDAALGEQPHQKDRSPDVIVAARDLLDVGIAGGAITESGVRTNVSVALQYLAAWLDGNGAAAINNLMEDAATAEISRSQLWQWRMHRVELDDGRTMSADLYTAIRGEELDQLQSAAPSLRWTDAAALLDGLVLDDEFTEFLTLPAYPLLG
jgi:malate synthase